MWRGDPARYTRYGPGPMVRGHGRGGAQVNQEGCYPRSTNRALSGPDHDDLETAVVLTALPSLQIGCTLPIRHHVACLSSCLGLAALVANLGDRRS